MTPNQPLAPADAGARQTRGVALLLGRPVFARSDLYSRRLRDFLPVFLSCSRSRSCPCPCPSDSHSHFHPHSQSHSPSPSPCPCLCPCLPPLPKHRRVRNPSPYVGSMPGLARSGLLDTKGLGARGAIFKPLSFTAPGGCRAPGRIRKARPGSPTRPSPHTARERAPPAQEQRAP